MQSKNKVRECRGGMLIFAILALAMLMLFVFIGLSFGSLFFVRSQIQKFADDIALASACKLNSGDRIGQVNNLVARCRQLAYASKQTAAQTIDTNQDLQVLARQLLNETYQNAQSLETERLRLQFLAINEAKATANTLCDQRKDDFSLLLPWLKTKAPQLAAIQFGNVSNVDSNVTLLNGIDTLSNYDRQKLVNGTTGLYFGNINASLPGSDKNIYFNLSSLAAPVHGDISPARLLQDSAMQTVNNNQLPSAIRIQFDVEIGTHSQSFPGTVLSISSAAATVGASPPIQ